MNSFNICLRSLLLVLAISFSSLSMSAKDIVYVKSGSSGDGSSWSKAFGNIQQAVDAAAKKGADVWVSKGIYKSDSSAVVFLKPKVNLYGGFAGTETSLAVRDTAKNQTVLDGNGKIRVIYQNNDFADTSSVVVDGFTIQNGTADNGGGAYLKKNTTVSNCIIRNNKASKYGSAIYASSAVIKNCQIICNAYLNYLYYTVRLSNCVMDSCVVKNNKSYYYGAIYAESNSQISNCEIEGNGSAYYNNGYRGSYFNATKINNCKFVNTNGAGACVELANSSVMSRCLFEGNVNVDTHVISINGNSLAEDCQILSNKTTSVVLYLSNGKINRCTVRGNTTSGRILSINYSSSSATNSLFCNNNSTSTNYETIYMYDRAVISNCTFVNNETKHGNFLYMSNSTLKNSILVGNKTNGNHSGFFNLGGINTIKNNMLEATFVDGNMDGSMAYAAFTDAENGDYSLSSNSYCINAGEEVSESLDLLGKARKQGGAVDMGAIESAYTKAPVLQKCGDIIYVKSGSKGDGTSWKSAFGDIQQAIFAASADRKKHQIWVAAGTYYGDTTLSTVVNLAPGISLYGGFAGTETSLAARDTAKNPTIIDGKNQRRVITQNYGFADSMAVVVDGFTIQNGTAANGGGVNVTANTTISNCIIKSNKASENGSAIYATSAVIKNCQIVGNTYTNRLYYTVRLNKCVMDSCVLKNNKTYYNSVIYAESNSNVTNCEIEGNGSAYSNNGYRGSYFNASKVDNCKFVNTNGAGACVELANSSVMSRCLFKGNVNVGTHIIYINGNSLAEDCQILSNTTTSDVLYLSNGKINRCTVKGNTTSTRILSMNYSSSSATNSLFCNNNCSSTNYEPIYMYDRAVISNCTFVNNETKHGNVLYMSNSTLKNSIVVGNKTNAGYSCCLNLGGTNTIKNNMFEGTFVDGNMDGSMSYAAFTDAENGDYSLSSNSYCINAGEEVSDSLDLLGKARKQGGAVDIGAIESAYTKAPVLQKCGDIIYVKSGSKGDGTSWKSAFGDIQQAIFAASADRKKHQIWVAAGTYYGDTTLSTVVNLAPGISLYGGFAGTETSLAARDTAKNPTIIDGKNQRRVITQNYGFADSMAVVIDGFTIQNGAAANGGGVNITANTTINNCIIKNNKASENGSAIYATSATIKNCQIVENTYTNRLYYTVRLNKCVMDSCVVKNNKTYYNSVICAENNSDVTNCEIEGNSSYNNNIGSYFNSSKISNCKFVKTSGAGAGVELRNASVIRDCQFEGNTNVNNQIIYAVDDNVLIEDCKIRNNTSTRNSFIYLSNSKINRCQITDNTVSSNVIESYNSKAKISNCLICDNTCPESYRTIYIYGGVSMINCTVARNVTKNANVIYMNNSTLKNSIIVGNTTNSNYSNTLAKDGTNTIQNNMFEGTFVDGNMDGSMTYAAFTDAENGDYSLSSNSYCINAGEDVADSLDLYGKARKQGGAVDMGAIESAYTKAPAFQKCGDIIYVKSGSAGDGTSWKSAFGDIQQAIFAASADRKKHQIWVAAGTYYGDTTLSTVVNLAPGISLYGGFAGTETSLAARDTAKNPTIIDGKNQRRVITQNYGFADSMAVVVDGFTIQNGTAAEGGGVNITANTTINNCIIKNNKASENGSAIYATSATIKNCQIVENTYTNRLYYTVRLNKCVMDSCVVKDNKSYYNSGICAENSSKVTNCVIEGNSSYYNYAGSYFNAAEVNNCKFVNTNGTGSSVELRNASVMRGCLFEGNTNVNTHIIDAADENVLVEDCKIRNNTSTSSSLIHLSYSKINRCQITGNTVSSNVFTAYNSNARISNCLICDNTCNSDYRTVYMNSGVSMINCTVARNVTKNANVIYMYNSTLKNSIIVGNTTNSNYSNILSKEGTNTIQNNMFEGTFVDGNMDGSMTYAAFTDAENGDYSLSANSYCINAGEEVTDSLDLLGKARKQGGAVDMGAIESSHKKAPVLKSNEIVYVKSGSNGDGTSWESAFGDIPQAIFAASADGKKHQIWVAAGTYYGDTTLSTVVNLAPGISLYGGFAGNEKSLSARDTANNPTILDGKNARRVVTQDYGFADSMAVVVDGFTIQNGYMYNGGGAYLCKNTTLTNCIVKNCRAIESGSAVYANGANVTNSIVCYNGAVDYNTNRNAALYLVGGRLDSCIVKNNMAYYTSALQAESVTVTNTLFENDMSSYGHVIDISKSIMTDCRIINNVCKTNSDYVVRMVSGSTLERCLIDGNETYRHLLYLTGSSSISNSQITNCLSRGYSLIYLYDKSRITNCTVADNISEGQTVYCNSGTEISNSVIVGNKRTNNSESVYVNGATIKYSMIEGGANGEGNIDGSKSSAAFVDASKGDYSLSGTSLCINAGTDVTDSLDFHKNVRKQSDAVDMGAIESAFNERATVGTIIYVKAGSDGSGLSWDDALGEINQAVTLASTTGNRHDIWVAKGTYLGDTSLVSAISLSAGVSLYGGFAGTESSLDERNPKTNVTIIDGKYKRRCIIQNYDFADSLAVVVDGFTIQNGSLSNNSGVNAKTKKNTTFNNCVFRNARAGNESVYAEKSTFVNCKFTENAIQDLEIYGGIIDSCSFVDNTTTQSNKVIYLSGTKMMNSQICGVSNDYGIIDAVDNSVVSHCRIMNNKTKYYNTIYLSYSTLDNSLVCGNEISNTSYSIISADFTSFITNSTIAHNKTRNRSAISYNSSSSKKYATIANSIIYGNKVTDDVRPQVVVSDYMKVRYCASDGDLTGENNIRLATSNSGSDASKNYVCFINAAGGDYRLHATSACIDKGLDSVMTAKTDINGGARVYGKAIDLGAIEFDGEYVQMLDYSQVVCNNRTSLEATFDSTISKIDWKIDNAGKVVGYETTSGSGTTIPSMQLSTSRSDIDTLTLKVTPYDKSGVAGVPFNYNYYVYPDFSKKKITFSSPKQAYTVNVQSTNMTIDWNKLSLPVDVDKYDLYVWKASQKMPSTPMVSFVKDHSKYLSGLDNHTTYKYMVKAAIACDTVYSDTLQFRIDIPVSLEVHGSAICELGTKLGESTSLTRSIKGFELTDSISYVITGDDAADFSVVLPDNWDVLTGGNVKVYYKPTDSKRATSNATVTFTSGDKKTTLYLKGVLANYYVFDAVVEKEAYRAGDTVAIKGMVTDAYDVPFANKNLKITLSKSGNVIKEFYETSDAEGAVYAKYLSSVYESGVYKVGISLSGEKSNGTYAEFSIAGISCNLQSDRWLVQKGDTVFGKLTVTNNSKVEVRDIRVKTITLADGCKVEFDSIDVLKSLESRTIIYRFTGDKLTEGTQFKQSRFRVESEDNLTADFTSYFYCEAPYGQIKVLPASISEYVSKQKSKNIELLLCNTGFGETGKVTIALPKNFEGMSIVNGNEIESIKSGDTAKVILRLAYYDGAKLNTDISGSIGVNCENGESTSISYYMQYTSSLKGGVDVDVVDEYYYNTEKKPHLAGATVEIKNSFNSKVVASGVSDSAGKVKFDSIPEGDYTMVVKADKHTSYTETVSVQAGQTLNKFVFLTYNAVTYTWNVERVEIEDKYEITIEAQYETRVPVPVVTISFPNGVPARERFNPGDKDIAYLQITNSGMIAAKNVRLEMPKYKGFKITPDIDHMDSLPANYTMIVPVTIERLNSTGASSSTNETPSGNTPSGGTTSSIVIGDGGQADTNLGNPAVEEDEEEDDDDETPSETDCDPIKVKWEYICDDVVLKEGYTTFWPCTSLPSYGGGALSGGSGSGGSGYGGFGYGGHGGGASGTANIGVITIKDIDCNPCVAQMDGWKSCMWDLIGLVPILGDLAEGTFRIKKLGNVKVGSIKDLNTLIETGKTANSAWNDATSNNMDLRNSISYGYTAITTGIGLIPAFGDIPFGCFDWICQALSCAINDKFASNCAEFVYDGVKDIHDTFTDNNNVSAHGDEGKTRAANVAKENVDFYKVASPDLLAKHDYIEYCSYLIYRSRMFAEIMGSNEAITKSGATDFLGYAIDSISKRSKIDIDGIKKLPVSELSVTEMIEIAERWNRSVDVWEGADTTGTGMDIADMSVIMENLNGVTNFYQYVLFRGFKNEIEMVDFIDENIKKNTKKSVCASVKLQISQTLTMTREAFDGTLTVKNGNEAVDMDAFKVILEVRDPNGNLANDLFQINTQSLSGISSVDGTSSIEAGKEAKAVFRFIPERGAAPTAPISYSFGGKFIYVDSGDTVTVDLDPVTLTVYPSPYLQIDYFMQRNILGDDALTLDRVEPTVPAALGVRIDNQGYGIAKNVKLETAQPEIVDNEKGLLIDFAIIGSSLNGKNCDLGSENIDFGNIEPLTAKTGVWWLTSSLLGHFTKYEASVVHANSFGNPELSLVKGIAIHELFKTVDAYGVKEDHVTDFLVNDDEDGNDTPDAIYYSDGGKDTVKLAKKAVVDKPVVSLSDSVITLTVTPSESGWNYAQMADPGDNFYEIKKVVRVKDSVEIPLDNVWTTFVTLPDGAEPVYENRLHFLDYMTTLGENDYDIYYSIRKNILKVTEITGVPENEETVTTPVDTVVVKFNRKIQKESFDYNDIELYCQAGDNLSDSTITVEQRDDLTYVINISSKTKISGFYKIEINVNDVFDYTGYPGEFGKNASWNQFIDEEFSPVVDINDDSIIVYAYQNSIYVKSTKAGTLDIYDILSRLIVKNARYDEGITQIAVLPKGIYIVNGNKVIVK